MCFGMAEKQNWVVNNSEKLACSTRGFVKLDFDKDKK